MASGFNLWKSLKKDMFILLVWEKFLVFKKKKKSTRKNLYIFHWVSKSLYLYQYIKQNVYSHASITRNKQTNKLKTYQNYNLF